LSENLGPKLCPWNNQFRFFKRDSVERLFLSSRIFYSNEVWVFKMGTNGWGLSSERLDRKYVKVVKK